MVVETDEDLVTNEDVTIEESNTEEEQIAEEVIEDSETSEQTDEEPEIVRDEEEEDRIVMIGDSAPEDEEVDDPEKSHDLVKKLRKVTRGLEKKNKSLQRQIEANERATAAKEIPVELGEKPTLKTCNYDENLYEQKHTDFLERKRKVEEQAAQKAKTIEEQNQEYEAKKHEYTEKKKEYGFKDFSEAEELVVNTFSEIQQGIMIDGVNDAALVAYALGKNPKKLEELSKITNNIKFAVELGKLESQLKITNKKAPKPETRVKAAKAGGMAGNSDKVLERLMAEADISGDRTSVVAYKRKLREKG